MDFFELSNRLRMVEMAIKKEWAGKSLKQLSLRKRHKINVIAIRQDGELTTDIDPDAPFVILQLQMAHRLPSLPELP